MTPATILKQLLHQVAPPQRAAFRADYRALTKLPGDASDLQQFLDDYLTLLVRLYAATAGGIWFLDADGGRLSAKALASFDRTGLTDEYESRHRVLLQFGLTQSAPVVVRPFSAADHAPDVANPTDSFVLVGAIQHRGTALGVVELFLGPVPQRGKTPGDCQRYAVWLGHLLRFLGQGIELRYLGSSAPLQPALVNLAATRAEIEAYQEAIRRSLEVTINSHAGQNFGSLVNNQTFVRSVHDLLETNGLRILCPECGTPAILRCQAVGNSKTGVFLYDHYLDSGRTFHGGPTTFPKVRLAAKPPRRRQPDR